MQQHLHPILVNSNSSDKQEVNTSNNHTPIPEQNMYNYKFIYSFKYDIHNTELCKLESRQLFNEEENKKLLFSNIKIDPSISPFIKNRFDILSSDADYAELLQIVKNKQLHVDGFKAEYLVLEGDETRYTERLNKLRDIGYCIEGDPDYVTPTIIYSICFFENRWYFGILQKHDTDWFKHKQKPFSFSSAMNMPIAKALVSIAAKGDKSLRLLDACCGVGTVLLEACISGFNIEGCDINWKACKYTKANLAHFNYTAAVHLMDIKDLEFNYDAAIIDLPYNLYSYANNDSISHIIQSTANRSPRIIIVSTADIELIIKESGLKVTDRCNAEKKGKIFARTIWVCEKVEVKD